MKPNIDSKTERIRPMNAARLDLRVLMFALLGTACSCLTGLAAGPEEDTIGLLRVFEGHTELARCLAVSRDGHYVLSGGHDRMLRLWDVRSGKELWQRVGHSSIVRCVALAPDGKTVLSGEQMGLLGQSDVKTGKPLRELTALGGNSINSIVFSADGKRALLGLDDQTLRLWDVEHWKELKRFTGHTSYVVCVALSPDGKNAISAGSYDHTARLWDMESGKELRRLDHREAVWAVAFSPDGKRVLTGCGGIQRGGTFENGSDNSMRLWEAGTGKMLGAFEGHRADVWCIAFSPDGKRALSGSGHWFHDSPDKSVRLWDVESRKEL